MQFANKKELEKTP